jgi:hypothetical protein
MRVETKDRATLTDRSPPTQRRRLPFPLRSYQAVGKPHFARENGAIPCSWKSKALVMY